MTIITKSQLSVSTASASITSSRIPTRTSPIEKMFSALDKSIASLIYDLRLDERSRPRPKAGTMWPTDVDSVVRRYQPTLDSIPESEKPSACELTTYDTMAEQQHEEAVDEEEAWRGFLDGVGIAHSVGIL